MPRNYVALPYEYIDEMEALDDETFGRLVRRLMLYSRDNASPDLSGLEMVIFQRMKMQEDRYKESYDNLSSARSAAGKTGAATRWGDSKNGKGTEKHSKSMASDSKAIARNSKNGNTETETETETNTLSTSVEKSKKRQSRFRPPTQEEVAAYCVERNNSVPSARFCDFYEANGWMVGKNHMKDWKAAVRNWERRESMPGSRRETTNERYSRELQNVIASGGGESFDPWGGG